MLKSTNMRLHKQGNILIARILVKPFGTIWKLKELCNRESSVIANKLYRFIYNLYQFEHGSAISHRALFLGVPNLPHGTKQIIITEDVKIGKNCVIFQQVTIESDTLPSSETLGSPVIGDNCYIYPGAKIIGNVTVGDNVRIGPNVVVNQNIPSNSFVTFPNKIFKTKEETPNRYYTLDKSRWVYLDNNILVAEKDEEIIKKLENQFQCT